MLFRSHSNQYTTSVKYSDEKLKMLQNLNVSKVSFYHPKSPSAHSFLVESQGTIDKEEGSQKTVDLLEKTLIS